MPELATLKAPIVTYPCDKSLRAVKVSDRINYLHCEDGHGIMTFTSLSGRPLFIKEISSQEDFKLNFDVFKALETTLKT